MNKRKDKSGRYSPSYRFGDYLPPVLTLRTKLFFKALVYVAGTGSFPGVSCGRGVTLTPHPLLVPRSKIEESYTSTLSLRAFVAYERVTPTCLRVLVLFLELALVTDQKNNNPVIFIVDIQKVYSVVRTEFKIT